MGTIFSGLRIRRPRKDKRSEGQTPERGEGFGWVQPLYVLVDLEISRFARGDAPFLRQDKLKRTPTTACDGWACFMLLGWGNRNKMRATLTIPSFAAAVQPH